MNPNKDQYKVLFKKIKADHNRIRSNEVEGYSFELPTVGKQFFMIGEAENKEIAKNGGFRQVNTSRVLEVERKGKVFTCQTESGSTYEITVLEYPKGTN